MIFSFFINKICAYILYLVIVKMCTHNYAMKLSRQKAFTYICTTTSLAYEISHVNLQRQIMVIHNLFASILSVAKCKSFLPKSFME